MLRRLVWAFQVRALMVVYCSSWEASAPHQQPNEKPPLKLPQHQSSFVRVTGYIKRKAFL